MNPTFSETEYRRLMLMAYLGEWMINAIRKEPEPAYEDLVSKINSQVQGTAMESLVRFDPAGDAWIPSEAFETEAHALIDQYDEKTFWEELTGRLTERDLIHRHGERAVHGMRSEQRSRAAKTIAKVYTKEFEERGLERMRIQNI